MAYGENRARIARLLNNYYNVQCGSGDAMRYLLKGGSAEKLHEIPIFGSHPNV